MHITEVCTNYACSGLRTVVFRPLYLASPAPSPQPPSPYSFVSLPLPLVFIFIFVKIKIKTKGAPSSPLSFYPYLYPAEIYSGIKIRTDWVPIPPQGMGGGKRADKGKNKEDGAEKGRGRGAAKSPC